LIKAQQNTLNVKKLLIIALNCQGLVHYEFVPGGILRDNCMMFATGSVKEMTRILGGAQLVSSP
jgi:hypothetical protein